MTYWLILSTILKRIRSLHSYLNGANTPSGSSCLTYCQYRLKELDLDLSLAGSTFALPMIFKYSY